MKAMENRGPRCALRRISLSPTLALGVLHVGPSRHRAKHPRNPRDDLVRDAALKELGELLRRHRPAKIEPLRLVTLLGLKKRELFFRLHALGHGPHFEALAHADDGAYYARFVGRRRDLADERLVDLE